VADEHPGETKAHAAWRAEGCAHAPGPVRRGGCEVATNSHAKGIVLMLANDVVGTGPRLQMLTDDPEVNRQVERGFSRWSAAVGLAEKLRTMRMARAAAGEEAEAIRRRRAALPEGLARLRRPARGGARPASPGCSPSTSPARRRGCGPTGRAGPCKNGS